MDGRLIILARHGETELNRLHIVQGSGVDPALNDTGLAQAAALHAKLAGTVDAVVSSGMVRANQTVAQFIADGLPHRIDPRLREIGWGIHEGKVATPESRIEYAELMKSWESGNLDARLIGGESAQELADRLWAGWLALTNESYGTILACLHGRALRCLACLVDGQPVSQMNNYSHSNAGYYTARLVGDKWQLELRDQTDHLTTLTTTIATS